ncbi:type II toxin-antitoxin system death-on-curing family toxin [Agrobacterium sp. CG674]
MPSPRWVEADSIITLNFSILEGTTERHVLRDQGALESAVARPQNYFSYTGDTSVSMLTAELIFGIGKAHAFEQGNKRTAWAAGRMLAYLNGFKIDAPHTTDQIFLGLAVEQAVTLDPHPGTLAFLLESWLKPL